MAILLDAVLNASTRIWNTLPEYAVEPPTAAEAAAQTVHINIMMTIVLWVAAIVVMLIYGPRNLSRHPRQVLATASDESGEPTTSPRVR
jgi:cytochrome b561